MASLSGSPRVLVALATYNERGNLAALVQEIHAAVATLDVLVIDDNSPDGTGQLADELSQTEARIRVLHRPGKLGLGTAIVAGIHYAFDHGYDFLITMDADFSHPPHNLPALLQGMDKADVMIGSRYVPGGGSESWPLARKLMSAGVNGLVRFLMRIPAHDTSGNYRCYRLAKMPRGDLAHMLSRGYSFQEELLYRCHRAGCRLGETPIIFANRRAGASKVNPREAVRSMAILIWLGLNAFFGLDR